MQEASSGDVVIKENMMSCHGAAGIEASGRDRVQVELGGVDGISDSHIEAVEAGVGGDVEATSTETYELTDYQLARDITRRAVRPPDHHRRVDMDEIFVEQPGGFILPEDKEIVCLLEESPYGLKKNSKQWDLIFGMEFSRINEMGRLSKISSEDVDEIQHVSGTEDFD